MTYNPQLHGKIKLTSKYLERNQYKGLTWKALSKRITSKPRKTFTSRIMYSVFTFRIDSTLFLLASIHTVTLATNFSDSTISVLIAFSSYFNYTKMISCVNLNTISCIKKVRRYIPSTMCLNLTLLAFTITSEYKSLGTGTCYCSCWQGVSNQTLL